MAGDIRLPWVEKRFPALTSVQSGAKNVLGELMGIQPAPCLLGMSCLLSLSSHDVKFVLTKEGMGGQHPTGQSLVALLKQQALSVAGVLYV